jgi:hypothetical protein
VLLAAVIGVGLIAMIRGAVTSRSVVIEPFDIAPNEGLRRCESP